MRWSSVGPLYLDSQLTAALSCVRVEQLTQVLRCDRRVTIKVVCTLPIMFISTEVSCMSHVCGSSISYWKGTDFVVLSSSLGQAQQDSPSLQQVYCYHTLARASVASPSASERVYDASLG